MNDNDIEFMFYTRTLSEDYRVFSDDGSETLDYAENFAPIMELSNVESDDERSAVVFADGGNIYVGAFGLARGVKDRANRDIRFSFCIILPESKRGTAMRIFSNVKDEWKETGKAAGSLIKEIPVTRKDWKDRNVKGEDVRFDYRSFLQWLMSTSPKITQSPKAGYMLKYFADTGELKQIRTGKVSKEEEEMSGLHRNSYVQPERRKPSVGWLAVACVLFIVSSVLGVKLYTTSQTLYETQQKESDFKSKLERANLEISDLTERFATVQESLNITAASLDIKTKEAEKWKAEAGRLKHQQGTTAAPKR